MTANVGMEICPIADLGKALIAAGTAIDIYGIHVIGSSVTAPIVRLYNGPTDTDTLTIEETTTANMGTSVWYTNGIRFSNGAFLDVSDGADVTFVTVFYKKV